MLAASGKPLSLGVYQWPTFNKMVLEVVHSRILVEYAESIQSPMVFAMVAKHEPMKDTSSPWR